MHPSINVLILVYKHGPGNVVLLPLRTSQHTDGDSMWKVPWDNNLGRPCAYSPRCPALFSHFLWQQCVELARRQFWLTQTSREASWQMDLKADRKMTRANLQMCTWQPATVPTLLMLIHRWTDAIDTRLNHCCLSTEMCFECNWAVFWQAPTKQFSFWLCGSAKLNSSNPTQIYIINHIK